MFTHVKVDWVLSEIGSNTKTKQIEQEDPVVESEIDEASNWPGYDYPLAFRFLKETDAAILYPVMKRSGNAVKGYIEWGSDVASWSMNELAKWVRACATDDRPRCHLLFSIGTEVVGIGSLAPFGHPRNVQVALWVAEGHQGKGIGKWICTILEFYAFNVFGYEQLFYNHDSSNRSSGKLPSALGFVWSGTFDDKKHAQHETGFWFSWKKVRPAELPPGAIDTGDFSFWERLNFPWKSFV
jgi:RimJ/RimL family protein N-acetyltransferase